MAIRYIPRSGREIESDNKLANAEVRRWLQSQSEFLFKPDQKASPERARLRLGMIHDVEAQQYWDAFRKNRSTWQKTETSDAMLPEYGKRTTYFALATTAILRARFVLTGVAMDYGYETCDRASWAVINGYAAKLASKEELLPQRRILAQAGLDQFVERYRGPGAYGKVDQTLMAAAGMAIAAVSEQIGANNGIPNMPPAGELGLSYSSDVWVGRRSNKV